MLQVELIPTGGDATACPPEVIAVCCIAFMHKVQTPSVRTKRGYSLTLNYYNKCCMSPLSCNFNSIQQSCKGQNYMSVKRQPDNVIV